METATKTSRTFRPIAHYWNLVKDIDRSQKLELATMLIDSVKPDVASLMHDTTDEEVFPDMKKEFYTPEETYELVMKDVKEPLKPYTMEELHARIDKAEREIAAGLGTPHEEVMRRSREKLARKKQELDWLRRAVVGRPCVDLSQFGCR